jgi:hypothetical protein
MRRRVVSLLVGAAVAAAVSVSACGSLVSSPGGQTGPVVDGGALPLDGAAESAIDAAGDGPAVGPDAGSTSDCTGWPLLCDTFERADVLAAPWSGITSGSGTPSIVSDATLASHVFSVDAPTLDGANGSSGTNLGFTFATPPSSVTFETWLRVVNDPFASASPYTQLVYLDCPRSGGNSSAFLIGVSTAGLYVNVDSGDTSFAPVAASGWSRVAVTVSRTATSVTVDGVDKAPLPRAYGFNGSCTLSVGVQQEQGDNPRVQAFFDDVRLRTQ